MLIQNPIKIILFVSIFMLAACATGTQSWNQAFSQGPKQACISFMLTMNAIKPIKAPSKLVRKGRQPTQVLRLTG
jgi:hypothetical protein